jgi:hypothetical protein
MVDDYAVKVKDESHIKVYNAIRERYFTDLPVCEEITAISSPDGNAHVENGVIRFKSDDIRHDVMYAFVAECLARNSDLKFLLQMASRRMISDYCRLWDYKKKDGERCVYIPEHPEEMYDLLVDGLQEEVLTHSIMLKKELHGRISERCKYL